MNLPSISNASCHHPQVFFFPTVEARLCANLEGFQGQVEEPRCGKWEGGWGGLVGLVWGGWLGWGLH